MNVLINGFASAAVHGLVEQVAQLTGVERVFWIGDRETAVAEPPPNLVYIDHQQALILTTEALLPVDGTVRWTDELLDLYRTLKPVVLKMQDRLDRYGPAWSYAQRETTFRRQFSYWLGFLHTYQIEYFVGSNVPHEIVDFVLAELCGVLRIPTLYFFQWTPDIILPVSNYRSLGSQTTRPNAKLSPTDRELIRQVGQRIEQQQAGGVETRPFYMNKTKASQQKSRQDRHWRKRALRKLRQNWRRLFSPTAIRYGWYLLVEKRFLVPRRDSAQQEAYAALATSTPDLSTPYVYLALHYQPEATTSPLGGDFVDQYLMVDVLLAAFPDQVRVLVKEHPSQGIVGRGEHYYELFARAGGRVQFVATAFSSQALQDNALAVATVTGTVGFEAIWKRKPVLVFGEVYYEGAPGVYRIRTLADAREAASTIRGTSTGGLTDKDHSHAKEFTDQLLERVLPANGAAYYHYNSVLGLPVAHNVRVFLDELAARFSAPAAPPQ